MTVHKTVEICKVGRRLITYERIYEPDPERCKEALRIVLKSRSTVKETGVG